jgi:hypothetical protein
MKEERLNLKDRFAIDGKEYILSTVALPISIMITDKPFQIAPFETMLFGIDENGRTNWNDLYYEQYYWEEDAEARHKELVEKARNGVKFWEEE